MGSFQKIDAFQGGNGGYSLLPLRFTRLDNEDSYVVTNLAGEYLVVKRSTLVELVQHRLKKTDPAYIELRARHFLVDDRTTVGPELLSIKLRSRYRHLSDFTCLHIFVVTLRCEHSCPYCQVSRQSENKALFDMSPNTAARALDLVFASPSKNIKIEFQGGEPLLNFGLIQFVVKEAERRNRQASKTIVFVIATNLALVSREVLDFCRDHSILISTSLDGPEDLHNSNRPRPGHDSYHRVINGIQMARQSLGWDHVSALMTTTRESLSRGREIVDEYVKQGFNSIFLRPVSPYGFAVKTKRYGAYSNERWMSFYRDCLGYIIDLNRGGVSLLEQYAAVILQKMLTSDDPRYVDLMSPSGIGIAAVVYNYDGVVYASDEGRMLAEMGDKAFALGNVSEDSYEEIFGSPKLLEPLDESFAFSAPMCNDCAFEAFCGADPVFHHGVYGDFVGRKPESEFCYRNLETFRFLVQRMEKDPFARDLFRRWATKAC